MSRRSLPKVVPTFLVGGLANGTEDGGGVFVDAAEDNQQRIMTGRKRERFVDTQLRRWRTVIGNSSCRAMVIRSSSTIIMMIINIIWCHKDVNVTHYNALASTDTTPLLLRWMQSDPCGNKGHFFQFYTIIIVNDQRINNTVVVGTSLGFSSAGLIFIYFSSV